jgi:feruloyl esterase
MDATNPDLSAFLARGGRIILKEDMSDTAQSPYTGLTYYESVVARMGQQTADQFFAAYATPGLPHTSTGIAPGTANAPAHGIPGQVDLLALLESWVESGSPPPTAVMLQTKLALPPHTVVASKPMCRYPQYPRFTGTTATQAADGAAYTCVPG